MGGAQLNLFHIDEDMLKYARESSIELSSKITSDINLKVKQQLVDGFRQGESALKLRKRIQSVFNEGLTINVQPKIINGEVVRAGYSYTMPPKRWAETVARTEANRWANEGRLNGYEKTGLVKQVTPGVTGDERTCPLCLDIEGEIYNIDEASDVLPVHPLCRCTWIPVLEVEQTVVKQIDVNNQSIKDQQLFKPKERRNTIDNLLKLNRVVLENKGIKEAEELIELITPKVNEYYKNKPKILNKIRKDFYEEWNENILNTTGYSDIISEKMKHLIGSQSLERRKLIEIESIYRKVFGRKEFKRSNLSIVAAKVNKIYDKKLIRLLKKYKEKDIMSFIENERIISERIFNEIIRESKIKVYRGISVSKENFEAIKSGKQTFILESELTSFSFKKPVAKKYGSNKNGIVYEVTLSIDDIFSFFFNMGNNSIEKESEVIVFGKLRNVPKSNIKFITGK